MTTRRPSSAYSSPEVPPASYDPLDQQHDSVEMHGITSPSWRSPEITQDSAGSSPGLQFRRQSSSTGYFGRVDRSGDAFDSTDTQRLTSPSWRSPEITQGSSSFSPNLHFPGKSPPTGYFTRGNRSGDYSALPPTTPSADQLSMFKSPATASERTFSTTMSRFRSDPDTQGLVAKRAAEVAQWGIHWASPVIMVSLFIMGVAAAIGHHHFYASLAGQPAVDQVRMGRFGVAFAFFVKATLVGSVVVSYRQRIWHTFRSKAMTVSAIDGLFAACEDPTEFRKWEMIKNAKLATFMALATWLIPLAAVLSPASLTSEIAIRRNETLCSSVPTLNFTRESFNNFRNTKDYPGYQLMYWNTTDINATAGYFDYYDQPSKAASKLSMLSAYTKRPVNVVETGHRSCEAGWNCTYPLEFKGPGYKCTEVASGLYLDHDELESATGVPFNTSELAPKGRLIYMAEVEQGEYIRPQVPTGSNGQPLQKKPPYPPHLGVFETEPVIWIGYAIDTGEAWPSDSPYAATWPTVRIPKIFKCEHYETMYKVSLTSVDGIQSGHVTSRTFLNPIIGTTWHRGPNGTGTARPTTNYVRPNTDVHRYKLVAAYHALGRLLRNFLAGTITDEGVYPLTRSAVSDTRLIDQRNSYPVPDLMAQIQSVYEDMILTLLSEPHLVIADNVTVPCTKERAVNVYKYHPEGLWVGYAAVVFVAFVFLVVGGVSMYSNGVASDTLFSRIMVTTRNPTIDHLSVGACLGSDPFPEELRRTKLRFGVLLEEADEAEVYGGGGLGIGKVEHVSFGTVGRRRRLLSLDGMLV
ncbi:hypothetical protein H2199_003696 [Coniosporium tulheliwenetii]|uniref:Uncharacterized protein n=1 Tax=Coniosporium tulheliwenetii TaxID=3383036 RepID=A0ACC2ZBK9_9PEZI|nr:hypothetical protein H2199_003696 [Cladosporium sp. JES 115]